MKTRPTRGTGRSMARATAAATASGLVLVLAASAIAKAAPADPNADLLIAQAAALQQSDFPTGWVASPPASTETGDKIRSGIPVCKRYQKTLVAMRKQPRVATPRFAEGNASVDSSVTVFPTTRDARRVFAALKKPGVSTCLRKATTTSVSQSTKQTGARVARVTAKKVRVPPVGDQSLGYETVTRIITGAETTEFFGGVEIVRVGRAIAVFSFQKADERFLSLRDNLVNAVVGRLGNSGGAPVAPA